MDTRSPESRGTDLMLICTVLAEHLESSDDRWRKTMAANIRGLIDSEALEQMMRDDPWLRTGLNEWRTDLGQALRPLSGG